MLTARWSLRKQNIRWSLSVTAAATARILRGPRSGRIPMFHRIGTGAVDQRGSAQKQWSNSTEIHQLYRSDLTGHPSSSNYLNVSSQLTRGSIKAVLMLHAENKGRGTDRQQGIYARGEQEQKANLSDSRLITGFRCLERTHAVVLRS